jgi:aldose 1-epimerase
LVYRHHESPGFPFPFDFKVTYTIKKESVQVEFFVHNTGNNVFPFGVGWHPYFVTETQENTHINFNSDKKFEVNESMIPYKAEKVTESNFDLANIIVDNAFRLTDRTINLKADSYQLLIKVPEDSFLQLYTPPNRNSIAIEPMSCISNAFNNALGLKTLKKQEEFKWEIAITINNP